MGTKELDAVNCTWALGNMVLVEELEGWIGGVGVGDWSGLLMGTKELDTVNGTWEWGRIDNLSLHKIFILHLSSTKTFVI